MTAHRRRNTAWTLRNRRARVVVVGAAAATALGVLAGCGSGGASPVGANAPTITIMVSAPISTEKWVADFMTQGAQLAADELNNAGGVKVGATQERVVIKTVDNDGSATQVAEDAREAVSDNAAALLIDGTGAAEASAIAAPHDLPVFIVFDGGAALINPHKYPTTYRLAPADAAMAMRLADYLAASHPKAGLISDDTTYGSEGNAAMVANFARDKIPVVSHATVPTDAQSVSAQVLAARHAGATLLSVWASPTVVAGVIQAARQSGWNVPIWTGPTGEDPLVRQQLAAHPQWLTGVGFVSFRITAEVGPPPYDAYRAAFTKVYGQQPIGVSQGGKQVVQPPDWSMFPFDTVKLVAAALEKSGAIGKPLQDALNGNVVITGANGDERGFQPSNHEGVSPDDMYFAQFHGFTFAPVTNDPLSVSLPAVNQLE